MTPVRETHQGVPEFLIVDWPKATARPGLRDPDADSRCTTDGFVGSSQGWEGLRDAVENRRPTLLFLLDPSHWLNTESGSVTAASASG